jgi:MFS family permease
MIFNPCVYRRRGMAMDMVAAGSSVGGIVFPILVNRLIPAAVGFGWAMRTSAFLILVLVFSCSTLKSRLRHSPRSVTIMAFVKPWIDLTFVLVALATFCILWAMFLPLAFIVQDARASGVASWLLPSIVTFLNAGSLLGRVIPGITGDRYGRLNTIIGIGFLTVVLILGLWIPARTDAEFVGFAVSIGSATAAHISLPSVVVAGISKYTDIDTRIGSMYGVTSLASLTGPPIGGALIGAAHGGFLGMKLFSGLTCTVRIFLLIAARLKTAGVRVSAV